MVGKIPEEGIRIGNGVHYCINYASETTNPKAADLVLQAMRYGGRLIGLLSTPLGCIGGGGGCLNEESSWLCLLHVHISMRIPTYLSA